MGTKGASRHHYGEDANLVPAEDLNSLMRLKSDEAFYSILLLTRTTFCFAHLSTLFGQLLEVEF